ncbi:CopG family ribbon-helix-helix protein [Phenylobacterium sp.]|uniref:CopG family ribbon-helix-helix protein n=1 Tax=Phenylobacterium sp. TaxID=1871053 RepID=UPI0035B1F745
MPDDAAAHSRLSPTRASDETPALARIGVSLPAQLLAEVDEMVARRKLPGRSQLIAELIRHELADLDDAAADDVLAGTITLIYKAESGRIRHALARVQSEYLEEVISSQHVFLEQDRSLEVLLVQGSAERLTALCDRLRALRAVQQLKLVTTTALLPPLHAHSVG